jgi:hypothetical protein
MHQKAKKVREVFWDLWKAQIQAILMVPREGQPEEWKAFKLGVKAARVPKRAPRRQDSIWELGGTMRNGVGKRVMKWEM